MANSRKRILITGIAGFIGSHLARALLERGDAVVGIDHLNSYYSPTLKRERIAELPTFIEGDIADTPLLEKLLDLHQITHVVHLAAQAGVRYSLSHPQSYRASNLDGFFSVLEALRKWPHLRLIFASSSSVYGLNETTPFTESDRTDRPANLYAATKKAGESLAFSYHHLYGISMTILRYFTVYGPMGRPDMAVLKFARAIEQGRPIEVFGRGRMQRDFTYIDDIVDGTIRAIDYGGAFDIFNLGKGQPEPLLDMIHHLEKALGQKADIRMLPPQLGDMPSTHADIGKARHLLGFDPQISLEEGIGRTVHWLHTTPAISPTR